MIPASPYEVYSIEVFLFYSFALCVVFLPPRWSLLCLLLAGNVAVIKPGFVSTSSVSWQNGVEMVLLPACLLLRLTGFRLPRIRWGFPAKAWAALVLYAAVSVAWSPFKLSGVKMVAYLGAWFVIYLLFHLAWRRGLIDQGMVIAALWGSLALACLQTYVLGNPLYGNQNALSRLASAQFAPFRGPQFFGPFLACLLALLLFSKERRRFRSLSIAACLLAFVLVGSRYAMVQASIVVFAWFLLKARAVRRKGTLRLAPVMRVAFLAMLLFLGFRGVMGSAMPHSRVNQLLDLVSKPQLADVGTFGWRLLMYERVIKKLSHRSLLGLAFGSGTSSAGAVAMGGQKTAVGLDPNRTINDEFLRAEYEWGFIGLGLGLLLLASAVRRLWRRTFQLRSLAGFAALAILPAIVLALLVENPLAEAGTSQSLGYVMVLSYGFAAGRWALNAPDAGLTLPEGRDRGNDGRQLRPGREKPN